MQVVNLCIYDIIELYAYGDFTPFWQKNGKKSHLTFDLQRSKCLVTKERYEMSVLEINEKKTEQSDSSKVTPAKPGVGFFFLKRLFDIVFSLLGLILLFVPMLIITVLICLESPGCILFKQARMGQNGKVFQIYKFRTMYTNAPPDMASREFTDMDSYLTPVGKHLRRTSLDELPQLYNILIGEMSFVGFRPVCLTETELNALREEYGVFSTRPGLTGLAQVRGRDNISIEEKAQIDAEYVANRSLKLDLWCLFKTVQVVLSKEGVI